MSISDEVMHYVRSYFQYCGPLSIDRDLISDDFRRVNGGENLATFFDDFVKDFKVSCDRFQYKRKRYSIPVIGYLYWRLFQYPSIDLRRLTIDDLVKIAESGRLTEEMISDISMRLGRGE